MESEKVKEIKKALEEETLVGNAHKLKFIRIDFNLIKNVLTLINELETKNEVLCVELSRYTENCVEMLNGTLKQFAERLKEKCEFNCKEYCCEATVSANDIDETLKDFINKGVKR